MPSYGLAYLALCHFFSLSACSFVRSCKKIASPRFHFKFSINCQYSSRCRDVFLRWQQGCLSHDMINRDHSIIQYTSCSLGTVLGNTSPGTVFLDTLPWANIRHTSFHGKICNAPTKMQIYFVFASLVFKLCLTLQFVRATKHTYSLNISKLSPTTLKRVENGLKMNPGPREMSMCYQPYRY